MTEVPMEALANEVAALLAAGDESGARRLVDSLAEKDPAANAIGLAALAVFHKNAVDCLAEAERARDLAPDSPLPLQYLTVGHLMSGDLAEAESTARRAVERGGGTRARLALANVLTLRGRSADAVAILRQVVAAEPSNPEALQALAAASFKSGEYGDAITCYAKAFDLNPRDQSPIQNLISMYAEIGRWLGAAAALQLSRKGNPPDDVNVVFDLVNLHLTRLIAGSLPEKNAVADVDQAVSAVVRSAASRPPRVRLVIARTLIDLGRPDEAREVARALEKQPLADGDRAHLLFVLGLLDERAQENKRALEHYLEALAVQPLAPEPAANAISLLLDEGTPQSFQRIADLLAAIPDEIKATTPHLLFNEGIYLQRTARELEARQRFQRVLAVTRGQGQLAELAHQALMRFGN